MKDVHEEYLMASATTTESPFKGTATHYSMNTGITLVEDAGWRYLSPVDGCPPPRGSHESPSYVPGSSTAGWPRSLDDVSPSRSRVGDGPDEAAQLACDGDGGHL